MASGVKPDAKKKAKASDASADGVIDWRARTDMVKGACMPRGVELSFNLSNMNLSSGPEVTDGKADPLAGVT